MNIFKLDQPSLSQTIVASVRHSAKINSAASNLHFEEHTSEYQLGFTFEGTNCRQSTSIDVSLNSAPTLLSPNHISCPPNLQVASPSSTLHASTSSFSLPIVQPSSSSNLSTTGPPSVRSLPQIIKREPQQYAAADSNSSSTSSSSKSFVPCKVCGDKASGYHYGVTSCEGCKGFFRRSIQKQIEYRCLRDGKCIVIRLNRNRCQYCRFKKCLSVGMSRDSVRYGRVPKRCRERSDSESNSLLTPESPESSDGDLKNPAVYDIILVVSQAHHANCDYTEELTKGLVRKPIPDHPPATDTSNQNMATSTMETTESQRLWLWQQFAEQLTPTIQKVVEFAKRIPGFSELSQDDQLILIKCGFFEIWLGQVARLVSDTNLTFFNGLFMTKQQLEIMYDPDFAGDIFQFAATFNALALNDTELALFSAVLLLSPERSGITDVKSIRHHQERLLDALKVQVGRNHCSEPQVLTTVLIKLPELYGLGAKHFSHLDWFRLYWDKLTLPPLFSEIFDIPKTEDEI